MIVSALQAERQGFEPWVPKGTTVFETAPIDHSGISPWSFLIAGTKLVLFLIPAKFFGNFFTFSPFLPYFSLHLSPIFPLF